MNSLDNAYALIIGVDFKQKTPQPLRDAQAIYDVLSDDVLCGYKKENITLLLDDQATMQGMFDALDKVIKSTNEDSSFLLYYSGHGGFDNGTSYLCPYDKIHDASKYISGKELRDKLTQIKSKRMFVLFDCCHAGAFFDGEDEVISQTISDNIKRNIIHKQSTLDGLAQEIDDEQGMVIVASSQAEERSWGKRDEDFSIFTTTLIEALKAKHKYFFADEYVRTVETVNYVFERTPQLFRELKAKDSENVITDLMQKIGALGSSPSTARDTISVQIRRPRCRHTIA